MITRNSAHMGVCTCCRSDGGRRSTEAGAKMVLEFEFNADIAGQGEVFWGCADTTPTDIAAVRANNDATPAHILRACCGAERNPFVDLRAGRSGTTRPGPTAAGRQAGLV
jgi:hypothetical protein